MLATPSERALSVRPGPAWAGWAVALLLGGVALLLCLRFPNPTPQYDEFYHLLTARSLLHDGDWTITDGGDPYERAWLFTAAVAWAQRLFGETMEAARVPSSLAASLLVGAVFLWVWHRVGWVAAGVSAGLVMLTLHPLNYATMARFYSPHALAVFGAAVGTFEVAMAWLAHGWRAWRRWWGWGVLTAGSALLALHLQPTTLIAATATGAWCLVMIALWWGRQSGPVRLRSGAVVLGLMAAGAGAFWALGGFAEVAEEYHAPRMWSQRDSGDMGFYHRMMVSWYAPLWLGLPVWAALGWRQRWLVGYALVFAGVSFALHSVMPTKADRYVLYALPFVFIVAGVGIAVVLAAAWGFTAGRLAGPGSPSAWRWATRLGVAAGLALVCGYGLYRMPGGYRAVRMLGGDTQRSPFLGSDWAAAAPMLDVLQARCAVTVHSATLKGLYYLGRVDRSLSAQGKATMGMPKVRQPVSTDLVADPPDLDTLRGRDPTGMVVVEDEHWRDPAFVTAGMADWLERNLDPVPVDPAWRLRVFTWGINVSADNGR